ncbi:MAG: SdiA-regulated domain-containing protein, partial [Gammaproteobacteria bacterium]|nr:SdiA-regulated domain-containing protein [Gammaproteobacteria bacterium]NNJ83915.1 hypothetical protein [Gammaproteobacteria bacterium]
MTDPNKQSFSLTYLDHFNIKNKKAGLSEPSGLALSHGTNALWTISDDTKKIFKLSLDGNLKKNGSFEIPDKSLEGITLDPTGAYLLTIKEGDNEIIQIQVDTQEVVERQRLVDMAGYETVAPHFIDSEANKGLEG